MNILNSIVFYLCFVFFFCFFVRIENALIYLYKMKKTEKKNIILFCFRLYFSSNDFNNGVLIAFLSLSDSFLIFIRCCYCFFTRLLFLFLRVVHLKKKEKKKQNENFSKNPDASPVVFFSLFILNLRSISFQIFFKHFISSIR